MLRYDHRDGNKRRSRRGHPFAQIGIRVNERQVRGPRGIPQDIDFVVIRRMRSDERTVSCKRLMHMQMHRSGCRLVLQFFPRVDVVKRRL